MKCLIVEDDSTACKLLQDPKSYCCCHSQLRFFDFAYEKQRQTNY